MELKIPPPEQVNHPKHYQGKRFEVIDIIDDFDLDFCLGNVIKYILRCGKKDGYVQELKKAAWYLNHKIAKYEKDHFIKETKDG